MVHWRIVKKLNTAAVAVAAALLTACGSSGNSSPATPTTPSTPTVPTVPSNTWSAAGSVVDTVSRVAIGGAQVSPTWELAAVTAAGDGSYMLGAVANPPTTPYRVSVSAPGFVTHEQWITWERAARTGVTLDLIRDAAPFNASFYNQMVRGTYDSEGAPWPVLRWSQAPKFYFKTVDQTGRPLEPEVVTYIRNALTRAVPIYTGGKYAATIETGTETRPDTPGWINVLVEYNLAERSTCGWAYVGRDPGEITLIINNVCSCGSIKIPGHVVIHEVGHALGFFHVPDAKSVMYPTVAGNCPSGDPSAVEQYHAAIAYQRPRGNRDPDIDPSNSGLLQPVQLGPSVRIKN